MFHSLFPVVTYFFTTTTKKACLFSFVPWASNIEQAKVCYSRGIFICACMSHCCVSSQSVCVCLWANLVGCVWVSTVHRVGDVKLGMVKFCVSHFLGSVMFITRTHSCLYLIPLKSRNDLISQTEITVPSADKHLQLSVLVAYCSWETLWSIGPREPSTLLITASSKGGKKNSDCKLAIAWQPICRPYGPLTE